MQNLIKIVVTSVFFGLISIGFTAPAEAFRPAIVEQTKCVNKKCTVVRTRTCHSTPGPNRTVVWVCDPWSKPRKA